MNQKISQQTYDETLLENQDIFDLSPEDAVTETLSQFEQQGLANLSSYLATSHPESERGKNERESRVVFGKYLEVLDTIVKDDGSVAVNEGNLDEVSKALDGIRDCCSAGQGNGDGRGAAVGIESDEKEQEGEGQEEMVDGDTVEAKAEENTGGEEEKVTKTKEQQQEKQKQQKILEEKNVAFLTLLHSSSSMFTFMSLLGAVPLPKECEDDVTTDETAVTIFSPTEEQEMLLSKVTQTLTFILTPRRAREREMKGLLRDSFVAFERLVMLIFHYVQLLSSSKGEDPSNTKIPILVDLIRLSAIACRNSERNKVSFVRALKNKQRSSGGGLSSSSFSYEHSTTALLIRLLTIAHDTYSHSSVCVDEQESAVDLMTELCKLVSILCRYDDFRPDTDGGGSLGVDSSYGMNVSSSHDHVLEFSREGIVPLLHSVTLLSLEGKSREKEEGQGVDAKGTMERTNACHKLAALTASALSATRVLAVNDEIVQAMVAVGTLRIIKLAMEVGIPPKYNEDDKETREHLKVQSLNLTSGAIGLIRNLCGNDEIKTTLCLGGDSSSSVLPSILRGMKLYRTSPHIQEHGCGALAAMALRKPSNALRIVQEHGAEEILMAMRHFPGNVLIQRQGALAIRNIVSRLVANPSSTLSVNTTTNESEMTQDGLNVDMSENASINVRDIFLDLGAEYILRHITGKHQGSVDEAYAALRDLGCKVSMVKYDSETNRAKSRTTMFGDVKPQFRPVYEPSSALDGEQKGGIEERIAAHIDGGQL